MRLALLCALVLGASGAAIQPRQETFAELLARMREHSGPVWAAHLRSDSEVFENGTAVNVRTDSQGLRFATYHCNGNLCDGVYFDGDRFYSVDMNGTTVPDSDGVDPYLRGRQMVLSLAFLAPDFTQNGGRIIDDGVTVISGVRYRTIAFGDADSVPMLAYVDPATASVRYARDVNGNDTFEYRDPQSFGGRYNLPTQILRNGTLLERYDSREVVSAPFEMPHGPQATFSNGPVTVRTSSERVIPIFPCTIGGIDARCLLDSGNSGLSISLPLAERLGLASIGSYQIRGLGDYATEVVRGGELQIGSMTLAPADYVVLHDIEKFDYDVVLGADMFAATPIEIDQAHHRLVFGATTANQGVSVPLAFQDFVPVVDVRLGTLPTELAIDTGDESSINLAYDFYEQHPSLFSATSERSVEGVGGSSVELLGTIPQVHIGDFAIPSATIGATRTLQGTAFGHVGEGLLSRYDVTIDYRAAALYFASPDAGP